jgi:hypothetical protein
VLGGQLQQPVRLGQRERAACGVVGQRLGEEDLGLVRQQQGLEGVQVGPVRQARHPQHVHLGQFQFPKQRVVARRVDQNMVPCIQQVTDDEVQRMVGTLGQQELTRVGLDAAFVEQPGQCLAQRQVAPGCAVAMVHPGKCLRLPATQVAAEFGAFHPTGRWPAIAHAHLVLLLQLFTQQRDHVHGFGHVAGGGLRARAAVLAHVVARPGPRLCVSACHQAVVGLDHRVA